MQGDLFDVSSPVLLGLVIEIQKGGGHIEMYRVFGFEGAHQFLSLGICLANGDELPTNGTFPRLHQRLPGGEGPVIIRGRQNT